MIDKLIKVAGTTFRPLPHDMVLKPTSVGERDGIPVAYFTAILMPEPTNAYDPQAVQVLLPTTDGSAFMVGYIPKTEPVKIHIIEPVMAEVIITDYRSVGDYNPSYQITRIEMEDIPSC